LAHTLPRQNPKLALDKRSPKPLDSAPTV